MSLRKTSRDAVWALYLGGLSLFVAAPVAKHLLAPALLLAIPDPVWPGDGVLVSGVALALTGAAVTLGLGRLIALTPQVAGVGIGLVGPLFLVVFAYLRAGGAGVWPSLGVGLLRLVLALAGGFAAATVARRRERHLTARAPPPSPPSLPAPPT
ncbi:MAG: hypothetical protein ACYCWW_17970 [Deltaproteobacteria bacterium]